MLRKLSKSTLKEQQQTPAQPEPPLPQRQPLQESQPQNQIQPLFGNIIPPKDLEAAIKEQGSSITFLPAKPPSKTAPNQQNQSL